MGGRIERKLGEYISEKRIRHCRGVAETAVELARRWNVDCEKARLAGLLHDVAREIPREHIWKLVLEESGGDIREVPCGVIASRNPVVLHAHAGMIIARDRFGVTDEEILRSISLHTTGSPVMGMLDRILFIADYIEPGRKFYGVLKARDLACRDLNEAMWYVLKYTLKELLRKRRPICDLTFLAYNQILLEKD